MVSEYHFCINHIDIVPHLIKAFISKDPELALTQLCKRTVGFASANNYEVCTKVHVY